jgi:inorganic pyrophosphatase
MADEPRLPEAVVAVPRGSRNKCEFDAGARAIRLDRVLYSSVHYPGDYGFLPGTTPPLVVRSASPAWIRHSKRF